MSDDNRDKLQNFERVSQVLRNRLHSTNNPMQMISQQQQHGSKLEDHEMSMEEDDSYSDYLFGNDLEGEKKSKKKTKPHKQLSQRQSQLIEIEPPPEESVPLKRTSSRALSESCAEIKKTTKTKTKYKKEDNVGNQILLQNKIDVVFRSICEPNRSITVNSLGHALQKFKINFEVKDVVDMLKLYSKMMNSDIEEEQLEDEEGENLDLSAKMNEQDFKNFYKMIRKKPK